MRRERNRLLQQWQQERKLSAVLEQRRAEADRIRNEELIRARQELEVARRALEVQLAKSAASSPILQKERMQDACTNTITLSVCDFFVKPSSNLKVVRSRENDSDSYFVPTSATPHSVEVDSPRLRDRRLDLCSEADGSPKLLKNHSIGGLMSSKKDFSIPRPWAEQVDGVVASRTGRRRRRLDGSTLSSMTVDDPGATYALAPSDSFSVNSSPLQTKNVQVMLSYVTCTSIRHLLTSLARRTG